MPAFESRRVRTQPRTVTGVSFGASPDRMARTLNSVLSIARELIRRSGVVQMRVSWRGPSSFEARPAKRPGERLRMTDIAQHAPRRRCTTLRDFDRHPKVRVLFARASKDDAPTLYGAISPIAFLRLSNGLGPAPCA